MSFTYHCDSIIIIIISQLARRGDGNIDATVAIKTSMIHYDYFLYFHQMPVTQSAVANAHDASHFNNPYLSDRVLLRNIA
jgi:hypothetical protein